MWSHVELYHKADVELSIMETKRSEDAQTDDRSGIRVVGPT